MWHKGLTGLTVFIWLCVLAASVSKTLGLFPDTLSAVETAMGGDKRLHLALAYVCSLSVFFVFCQGADRKWQAILSWVLILLILFTLDEGLQMIFPLRQFSWEDLAANYLGLALALITWFAFKKLISTKNLKEQLNGVR